jgi:hypothetical protein
MIRSTVAGRCRVVRSRRFAGRARLILAALIPILSLVPSTAPAGDPWEAWPELWAFVRVNPQTRLLFDLAYARGKESPAAVVDMAAYVDVAIRPIARKVLRQEDWVRNRYLWARIGYDHVFKSEDGQITPSEERGILALYGRREAPWGVWIEGRVRTDLRWIDSDYSTRYRFRAEGNREFSLLAHPTTPYINAECFYDTRYDGWTRLLYQAGVEFTMNSRFRLELYLARQEDLLPSEAGLYASGAVAKFYF